MSPEEYRKQFAELEPPRTKDDPKEADTRAGRALAFAADIRKFEIELYWKRATYYWTFIAAAFAGYGLTFKTSTEREPWLSTLFASLGLVFSFAWYLVNRGSKFWQNNWERHVDLLEDLTLGPLYKVIARDSSRSNFLTSAGEFSVSKINQILSAYVCLVWALLLIREVIPACFTLPVDGFKLALVLLTALCLVLFAFLGRSSNKATGYTLSKRDVRDET